MISQIQIKNFKSIVDLTLDLGRVNLFIGENGSGKSNILEAVAFASSTNNFSVNETILAIKGARITQQELYSNAFEELKQDILLTFLIDNNRFETFFQYDPIDDDWRNVSNASVEREIAEIVGKYRDYIEFGKEDGPGKLFSYHMLNFLYYGAKIKDKTPTELKKQIDKEISAYERKYSFTRSDYLTRYIIYAAENSALRKFEEEGQMKPLGFRGEGLFSLLKSMASENGTLQHLKEHLEVVDWFEDFSIPNDLMSNEFRISIKDRFINSDLKYFDQRSANEGFLFLLFYVVLFSSKKTPQFFAIDNIEASFNPKLCAKLINMLVELSKKNEKQVLMTTHNPATLDGLNLNDPEQRLFVVRRNIDGHTIATRIEKKPELTTPMKLSEMWTKGLLGGLPDNF